MTGQNATDDRPTNQTRDALAGLAFAVREEKLWVQFAPGEGVESILRFLPDAARAAVDTEWRGLDRITVRREDWERYEAMGAVSRPAMLPDPLGGGLNFISLGELVGVGVEIEKRKFTTPPQSAQEAEIREIAAFSNTASALHQAFHNARAKGNTVPGWVEVNKQTGKPLYNDSVADEGMAMLTHICGWRDRNLRETIENAKCYAASIKAGFTPDQISEAHDPRGGAYKDFFRAREIGFDRDEVVLLLVCNGASDIGYAIQEKERKRRSRYNLIGAAVGLARVTGRDAGRWLKTIVNAVLAGELAASNPHDFEDSLPYTPSRVAGGTYAIREDYEQVSATNLNVWLDEHPEWNVSSRFPDPGGDKGNASLNDDALAAERLLERQGLGRYRLSEASEKIVPGQGAHGSMLRKLQTAVCDGSLQAFQPGSNERREMDHTTIAERMAFLAVGEVYWDDLNNWLAANEPRMKFGFPNPDGESTSVKEGAAQDWRQRVRDAATEWCSDRNKRGLPKPTKKAVCIEMAVWCRNNKVVTDTGINPASEYLRKHVLRYWKIP